MNGNDKKEVDEILRKKGWRKLTTPCHACGEVHQYINDITSERIDESLLMERFGYDNKRG